MRPAALGLLTSWFVALPDSGSAAAVADQLAPYAADRVDHPSGRPWLLGRWPRGDLVTTQTGPVAVALLGEHSAGPIDLMPAAQALATGIDRLVAPLPGSYHLLASIDGVLRLQGSISALRRLFTATAAGVPIAADRADALAALLGLELDPVRVAAHLLEPQSLHPLAGEPVWRGVTEVPAGRYLRVGPDGAVRTVRWWMPPDPVTPLAEGADALRAALTGAVQVRTAGRGLVTCDLGGLDSTAVCSIAARSGARLVAFTADVLDPLGDDVRWARRTTAALGIEHHVVPADQMPLSYAGLHEATDHWDEPCFTTVDRSRWLALVARAADRGSTVHLTGIGGDELLYGSIAHLHTLFRRHPVTAWRQIRGFAAKYGWRTVSVLRQLLDNDSYGRWLHRVATNLTTGPEEFTHPLLTWGFEPRLPPWTTPEAAAAVRDLIRARAATVHPISPRRGQHRELEAIRLVSRTTRQLQQAAAGQGLRYAAPYYDDAVITAALSVHPAERITPWRYKPLIAEAMRDIVPEGSRTRSTKVNANVEEEIGLREHRETLLSLCEDPALARLGLVDAAALREACSRPLPSHLQMCALHQTVAVEIWLRALDRVSDRPTAVTGGGTT